MTPLLHRPNASTSQPFDHYFANSNMVSLHATKQMTNRSITDTRSAAATALMQQAPQTRPPTHHASPKELIKAVIIHCDSDAYPTDALRIYQPTAISPLETQLHTDDTPLDIPTLAGLPLWTRPHAWTGPHGDQRKPASEALIENPYARPFSLNGDADSADFGTARAVRGDRLFGRTDGRDLLCQHLVCLGAFCNAVVEAAGKMEAVGGTGGERRLRSSGRKGRGGAERGGRGGAERGGRERGVVFRGMANREEFQRYWVRWCRKKFESTGSEEWLRQTGPFDV